MTRPTEAGPDRLNGLVPAIQKKLERVISLLEQIADRADTVRLLTRDEAAEVLGISVRKLDALEEAGEIQAIRIGRSVRYHPDVLERFIRRRADDRSR